MLCQSELLIYDAKLHVNVSGTDESVLHATRNMTMS